MLICSEMPEARFEDVMRLRVPTRSLEPGQPITLQTRIDYRFQDVCEPGTICVVSVHADAPCATGGYVDGDLVRVTLVPTIAGQYPQNVIIRLSGVRRGYGKVRFARMTREDMERNHAFWGSWRTWPKKGS